ncbi:MAG TPA: hypothetical protein ENK77_02135 [Epsilonproteobacteria bacterium]|nr:hypothetical protein [Campylobacterota bacterium]
MEDVIASWRRALSQEGLISGNFYSIYNENASGAKEGEGLRRLKEKRDADVARIVERMDKVSIERAYRIIKALESFAKEIKEEKIPALHEALQSWRRKVLWSDGVIVAALLGLFAFLQMEFGLLESPVISMFYGAAAVIGFLFLHAKLHGFFARRAAKQYKEKDPAIANAILHNTKWWRPIIGFGTGWHKKTKSALDTLMSQSKEAIQKLNDQFVSTSAPKTEKIETEDVFKND